MIPLLKHINYVGDKVVFNCEDPILFKKYNGYIYTIKSYYHIVGMFYAVCLEEISGTYLNTHLDMYSRKSRIEKII
jgi:hypothetical protein